MLERLIAYYCALALAGIKPANIASCSKKQFANLNFGLEKLNGELNRKDIFIEILCECEKRALLIVYRRNILERHLSRRCNKDFLKQCGYPEEGTAAEYLTVLRAKLRGSGFPHEIGVFLGYPLCDIYGFINHRDKGCLLVGEWKVYHNADEAENISHFFLCHSLGFSVFCQKNSAFVKIHFSTSAL